LKWRAAAASPGPGLIVCAAVAWDLVSLRGETLAVSYRDDGLGTRAAGAVRTTELRAGTRLGGFTTRRQEVNGQPGALFFDREGRLGGVMILDVADGQIQAVSAIVNPDKLRHLGPVADLRVLRRERT
jgi:hypothetical protein